MLIKHDRLCGPGMSGSKTMGNQRMLQGGGARGGREQATLVEGFEPGAVTTV
jgi:hypothetical protein